MAIYSRDTLARGLRVRFLYGKERTPVNGMKIFITFLTLLLLVLSCTKDKQSAPLNTNDRESRLPEIVSATLNPAMPTSNTPLSVQYDVREVENTPVHLTFRWYVDRAVVQEGPNPMLEPGPYKKGASVFVEIIPTTSSSAGKPFKSDVKTIGNMPPEIVSMEMKPSKPAVGDIISVKPIGTDPDNDFISYRYEWTVNGRQVPDLLPEQNTFNTSGLRKHDVINVVVIPTDGEATGDPKLSEPVALENSAPRIISTPTTTVENGVYVYQVKAKDPDGDVLNYALVESPAGMTIDRKTGLIRWEPPKSTPAGQEIPIKILVDDGDGGKATQEYTMAL